ncbi:MAG: zinc ribbon domain-containing protein [Deltaproteobacteria bacterium]|nr:MAG: zinc ribbon domain-containing protein [Deltaproteobacteria bacterium]
MPIYEYRCRKCGNEFEVMQRITESPLKKCPSCGGRVDRLISNTSFILKGTGWYATDYARKDKERKEKKATSRSESEEKGDSTSGEKKEAATAPAK